MNTNMKIIVTEKDGTENAADAVRRIGASVLSVPLGNDICGRLIRTICAESPAAAVLDGDICRRDDILYVMGLCGNVLVKPVFIVMCSDMHTALGYPEKEGLYFMPKNGNNEIMTMFLSRVVCRADETDTAPAVINEKQVTEIIQKIGIPANIKGYQYLRCAIMLAMEDMTILDSITKRLYPAIAAENNTTSSRVERAIRHAITSAWQKRRGDTAYFSSRYNCTIDFNRERPTNSELIALLSDCLRLSA